MGRIKKNHFLVLGLSHKTAPVEIREKVHFESSSCGKVLSNLHEIAGVEECVLLSTCNRTEIYAVTSIPHSDVRKRIEDFICTITNSNSDILQFFYYYQSSQAIEHLFQVTSGLDSMILGEPQIFGQVKYAYTAACDNKCTASNLNRLFHHAFRVGKLIRSSTGVGEGTVSVSFAAAEFAKRLFGSLSGRSVLLIGAGKTGKLCAQSLIDYGIERLFIANRTPERARSLSGRLNGEVIPFEAIYSKCEHVDIIIASVTAKEPIITKKGLLPHINHRTGKPLLIIDLGVPRNIEPEVAENGKAYLYNIDDLENLTLDNMDKRKSEAEKALGLIKGEVEEFCSWLSARDVVPVVRNLHVKCESIRQEELERIKNVVSPETFETLDIVTRRIVRKILHNPVIAMRDTDSEVQRERLAKSIHELFIKEQDKN